MKTQTLKWIIYFFFALFPNFVYANKFSVFASGGGNVSSPTNNTFVSINSTVTNRYAANDRTQWEGMWGVGIAHSFYDDSNQAYQFSLGLAGYGMDLGAVSGTEYPFSNGGQFDTLNYRFKVKSTAVFLESRFLYTAYCWKPFIILGLGSAWNQLYNYTETPTDPASSAAAVVPAYANKTQQAFAYELGAGVQYQILNDSVRKIAYLVSLDYRFLSLGKGELGSLPSQPSAKHLQINAMSTQSILLSFIVSVY